LQKATISFVMSVRRSARNNSTPTGRICMKFDLKNFSKICQENSIFITNLTRITGTLHEDYYTFLIMLRSVLLRIRHVSDQSCRGNQNTSFVFKNLSPPPIKSCPLWDKLKKIYIVLYSRADHRWQYGSCALHAGYLRIQHRLCNNYRVIEKDGRDLKPL